MTTGIVGEELLDELSRAKRALRHAKERLDASRSEQMQAIKDYADAGERFAKALDAIGDAA